jgi:Ca-activated chloride channel family protein
VKGWTSRPREWRLKLGAFTITLGLCAPAVSPFSPSALLPFTVPVSASQDPAAQDPAPQDPTPQAPASFKSGSSELVVLPVVVTDKQGRYVSDLDRDRFTVFDNGRRIPIELFSNEDTPLTVGLIIDASGSMRQKIGEVISASIAFARSSNPDDELFAIRFNDDVRDVVRDRRFLLAGDLVALGSALGAMRPEGRTALYDALVAGLEHLARGSRSRKALVVVSDGGDNASEATLDGVLARARESNAAIYTIGLFDDDDLDKNPGVLKSLARATGGERFLPRSPGELLQTCVRIAREIRSGYTIGYVPPDRDGAYHRIRVNVQPAPSQKVNVRTRPGYFAAARGTQPER